MIKLRTKLVNNDKYNVRTNDIMIDCEKLRSIFKYTSNSILSYRNQCYGNAFVVKNILWY